MPHLLSVGRYVTRKLLATVVKILFAEVAES
jgi:hypothetical protein